MLCVFRGMCVFGVGDLQQLSLRHELFANKFFPNFQPLAFKCLEDWHRKRVQEEITSGKCDLDLSVYEQRIDSNRKHVRGKIVVKSDDWLKRTAKMIIYDVRSPPSVLYKKDARRKHKRLFAIPKTLLEGQEKEEKATTTAKNTSTSRTRIFLQNV